MVGPQFLVAFEIVEENVAAGAHVSRILVEIDLVRAEEHLRVLDLGGPAAKFIKVGRGVNFLGLEAEVPLPDG
jgi:hypothetical protein